MAKPAPQGGLVIRYDYLWTSEERKGREEGAKKRPCAVVVAIPAAENKPLHAVICGITHTEPENHAHGIKIPPAVGAHLGLGGEESWIVTNEVNLVDWDDPGIVPITPGGAWSYGFLPPALAKQVRDRILALNSGKELSIVDRPRIEKRRATREMRNRSEDRER